MNDAGLLRKDPARARKGFESRNPKLAAAFDEWLKLDESYRGLLKEVEDLRSR